MLIALAANGDRILPTPGTSATCPTCTCRVRSKCGQIVTWHWAHQASLDCDSWSEPDTDWHRSWQNIVPIHRREVVMGNHRADIVATDGTVIELQHSHLPPAQIQAREAHYGRMVWVFDARDAVKADRLNLRRKPDGYTTFRWKHPRKSIVLCRRRVILDVGNNELLMLGKIHVQQGKPCGGWGYLRNSNVLSVLVNGPTQERAA